MDLMQLAANFGFPALMSMILLLMGKSELGRLARAVDRMTRALTTFILSMPWMPDAAKANARDIDEEIKDDQKGHKGILP